MIEEMGFEVMGLLEGEDVLEDLRGGPSGPHGERVERRSRGSSARKTYPRDPTANYDPFDTKDDVTRRARTSVRRRLPALQEWSRPGEVGNVGKIPGEIPREFRGEAARGWGSQSKVRGQGATGTPLDFALLLGHILASESQCKVKCAMEAHRKTPGQGVKVPLPPVPYR